MKARITLILLVCGIALTALVTVAEADILSYLMANPPQAPYVGKRGPTAQPAERPVAEKNLVASQGSRPQGRTVLAIPSGDRSDHVRVVAAAQRSPEVRTQHNVPARPVTRYDLPADLRLANASPLDKRVRVAERRTPEVRAARTYPRIKTGRTQPLLAASHSQPARTGYVQRYPQPPTYAAPNNYYQRYYYQGYPYQGWGSTNSAACPPGRT